MRFRVVFVCLFRVFGSRVFAGKRASEMQGLGLAPRNPHVFVFVVCHVALRFDSQCHANSAYDFASLSLLLFALRVLCVPGLVFALLSCFLFIVCCFLRLACCFLHLGPCLLLLA